MLGISAATWTAAPNTLAILAALLVGYLAVPAARPWLLDRLPARVQWFGQPNSAVTLAIVVAVLALLVPAIVRIGGGHRPGAPLAVVAGLAAMSAFLGIASYWA